MCSRVVDFGGERVLCSSSLCVLRMKEIKDIFPDYHDGEFLAPKSG